MAPTTTTTRTSTESTTTNTNNKMICHLVADALTQLEHAKKHLADIQSDMLEDLSKEKDVLQVEVRTLRAEKTRLSQDISKLKEQFLHEETFDLLEEDLEDTPKEDKVEGVFILDNGAMVMTPLPDNNNENAPALHEDEDTPQEDNHHILGDGAMVMGTMPDYTSTRADRRNPVQAKDNEAKEGTMTIENLAMVEEDDDSDAAPGNFSTASASTATSSVRSGSTKSSDKKPRVSKAFSTSPKKWRRMIRTHRLQSILIQ